MGGDRGGGAEKNLFEFFCQFASDADLGIWWKHGHEDGEGFGEAMGRLEVDRSVSAGGGGSEFVMATARLGGEKATEVEGKGGQAAGDEGMDGGGGAGDDLDGEIFAADGSDNAFPGVGDGGHARIGNEGDGLTGAKALKDFCLAGGLIKFLVAEKRFFEAEVLEEEAGVAGVFGGDEIGGGKGLAGAGGDIGKVADGGTNDEEAAGGRGHRISLPAAALGLEPRTPTFRVWCATNCTTRQSGKAYRWVKMRARSGELGWGGYFVQRRQAA